VNEVNMQSLSHEQIVDDIVSILQEMVMDWDLEFSEPIGPNTRLITDLGFESIDVVQLVVAIEQHYDRRGLPWEEILMVDGHYVNEMKTGQIVDFLQQCLNNERS
jgi:acyl carrier protein